MNNKDFTEKIYGPYNEAWKLIKLLQHCAKYEETKEYWDLWYKELERYSKKYPGNKFAEDLKMFVGHTAANDIRGMNEGKTDEAQDSNT